MALPLSSHAQLTSQAIIKRRLKIPPLPRRLIARERLENRLIDAIGDKRLVIVSASAGAGKTTAIVRALARVDRPTSWLTLDAADCAAGRLLTYIEAALTTVADVPRNLLSDLLAHGVSHEDAAGVLVEHVGDAPAVVVLDELDRVHTSPPAWGVIEAFVRYAPDAMTLVLVSRRPVLLSSLPPADERVAWILEEDLALDEAEVSELLALAGNQALTAAEMMRQTSGWVTGVVFDAWRHADPAGRVHGASDPLHGYLATQILAELGPEDQRFLIDTSLLEEVSERGALALGMADAAERLASLRAANLPGTWTEDGAAFRPHSRFREFLVSKLPERKADEVRALHRRHATLLLHEGLQEEAVEALLTAGELAEAAEVAARVLLLVLERLDVDLADRWLQAFKPLEQRPIGLVVAEVMLAAGREDFPHVVQIADALAAKGMLDDLFARSSRAGALIAWAFAHAGRIDDVADLVERAGTGPDAAALRYMLHLIAPTHEAEPLVPALSGGPLDALVIRDHYMYGRLGRVLAETSSGWVGAVATPWRIAALRAVGHVHQAADLLDAARTSGIASLGLLGVVGPEVHLDAGAGQDAWAMVEEGAPLARKKGSVLLWALNRCVAAKIALRGLNDPQLCLTIAEELSNHAVSRYRVVNEGLCTWRGMALLRLGRDAEALSDLEEAVWSMHAGDRCLDLPAAAVFLAEARWRSGDEDGADAAADHALAAADRQGSQHILLQALADFPAVLSRRLDAEPDADSRWHALGRSLWAPATQTVEIEPGRIRLRDLGRPAVFVDGEIVRARISKAVELLAYLLEHPPHEATREHLLDALFDRRSDPSAKSYLRQAIHWLRQALPEGQLVDTHGRGVKLQDPQTITRDSHSALRLLGEAQRHQEPDRSAAIRDALEMLAAGDYLEGSGSAWVVARREDLQAALDEARLTAAASALADENYAEARALADQILLADPYKESVWRLRMRASAALGDEQGVIEAFRRCHAALQEIGADVAPATSSLLTALRR